MHSPSEEGRSTEWAVVLAATGKEEETQVQELEVKQAAPSEAEHRREAGMGTTRQVEEGTMAEKARMQEAVIAAKERAMEREDELAPLHQEHAATTAAAPHHRLAHRRNPPAECIGRRTLQTSDSTRAS